MTFDEIIEEKINRRARQIELELKAALDSTVSRYLDPTFMFPFSVDVTSEINALMSKLSPGIKTIADREVIQKLLKVFD